MYDSKLLRRASVAAHWGCIALCFVVGVAQGAETSIGDQPATSSNADPMQVRCIPAAERAGRELGCFITDTRVLGELPDEPLYWYLRYLFDTRSGGKSQGKIQHGR